MIHEGSLAQSFSGHCVASAGKSDVIGNADSATFSVTWNGASKDPEMLATSSSCRNHKRQTTVEMTTHSWQMGRWAETFGAREKSGWQWAVGSGKRAVG